MADAESVDRALTAGIKLPGGTELILTKFEQKQAAASSGKMAQLQEADKQESKRRTTRVQFQGRWTPQGPDLGLSGWVSVSAKSGETILEQLEDKFSDDWRANEKRRLLGALLAELTL